MMRVILPVLSTQGWAMVFLAIIAVGMSIVAVYQIGRRG